MGKIEVTYLKLGVYIFNFDTKEDRKSVGTIAVAILK